jgi:hypothetical protein
LWSGALSGGYVTGVDDSDFSHGSIALGLGVFGGGGGKLGFGAEVGYDHQENRSEVVEGLGTVEHDRSALHLTAMLRLGSPSGSVRPYAVAGQGVYALRQDNEDFVAPGLNLGTGLEFYPGEGPLGLSAGARIHLAGRAADGTLKGAGFLASCSASPTDDRILAGSYDPSRHRNGPDAAEEAMRYFQRHEGPQDRRAAGQMPEFLAPIRNGGTDERTSHGA